MRVDRTTERRDAAALDHEATLLEAEASRLFLLAELLAERGCDDEALPCVMQGTELGSPLSSAGRRPSLVSCSLDGN
jgi:hypothetical protein